jgi:probable HAF family extracellular repeat protein
MVPSGGYVFKTIDDPNGVLGNYASGINSRGDVVGTFYDVNFGVHGFLRTSGGQYTTLNDPNAGGVYGETSAKGINNRGQIVGFFHEANGTNHSFLLSGDHYTTLDDPNAVPSPGTFAYGINDRGQIVGYYYDAKNFEHGFLLSGGQYTTIDYPNAPYTLAQGINDRSQIVGWYQDANGGQHGFLLSRDGHYTTLDDPSAVYGTSASGINDRGQIVGDYYDVNGVQHGFLLSDGQYTTLDDPNAVYGTTLALGINDSGKIVGNYSDANGIQHGFLAIKADDALSAGTAPGISSASALPTAPAMDFAPLASSLFNTGQPAVSARSFLALATPSAPRPSPTVVSPAAYTKLYESGPAEAGPFVQQQMSHWQEDSDLAGIRDRDALAKLPAEETAAFTQLWADVAAQLTKLDRTKHR